MPLDELREARTHHHERLMNVKHLQALTTPSPIWLPYVFDHVTISEDGKPVVSILGLCHSDYSSGPSLFMLADAAGELLNKRDSYFGLVSCRYRGFRFDPEAKPAKCECGVVKYDHTHAR